jgi:hypothetical protein
MDKEWTRHPEWTRRNGKEWTKWTVKMDKTPNQNISIQGNVLITFVVTRSY